MAAYVILALVVAGGLFGMYVVLARRYDADEPGDWPNDPRDVPTKPWPAP